MNGWIIFGICMAILSLVSIGRLYYVYWDVKKMTEQLKNVNAHFGTNERVRTNSHNKKLSQFANEINRLIHLYKENERYLEKREIQLKEEITNISHDLRTPLTSIKGFSELLLDEELSHSEKNEYLSIVQGKIDVLTTQVDLFYELWSIDSSDHKLEMKPIALNEIIEEKMLMFYQTFYEKELDVIADHLQETRIIANEEAVDRILTNMIQNALRYAKSYVRITLFEEQDFTCFRMINDTKSLTEEDLSRIFSRGYRKDQSRGDGQLGLGLHIVQQLMQKQGGKVLADVEDEEFTLDILFYNRK